MKNDKYQNDDVLHNALYIKCNDYLWLMIDAVKRGEEEKRIYSSPSLSSSSSKNNSSGI